MPIKSYLITDPSLFGTTADELRDKLQASIDEHSPDFICLRDKSSTDYVLLAEAFLALKGRHLRLLHGDVDLAIDLHADGVHLRSDQLDEIHRAKAAGLYVIASTHTYDEAQAAQEADAITYSPIFHSPGKGNPKGLEDLKEITGKINTKIFALGGIITSEQIDAVAACHVYGFASIRYFMP